MAGLSTGLPGGDRSDQADVPSTAPRAEQGSDLAGPDAPTTAMSIPGQHPTAGHGGSADDRTVKMGGAQTKSAQADVPTAGMDKADLAEASEAESDKASAPSGTTARAAVAGAGAVAAGAVAGGGSGQATDVRGSKSNADGDSDTLAQHGDSPAEGAKKAAARDDSAQGVVAEQKNDRPAAARAGDEADTAAPTEATATGAGQFQKPRSEADSAETTESGVSASAAGAGAGEGDSRADKPVAVDATEKFRTDGPKAEGHGSEDKTVAMQVVSSADAPTTAMPVQRANTTGPGGTDRVRPPAGGRPAMTPPPNTPRPPAGPRQAGQLGLAGPGQVGPGGPGQHPAGPGQHGPTGPGQYGPAGQGQLGRQGQGPQSRPTGPGQPGPADSDQQGPRGAGQQGVEDTQPSPPRGPDAPQRTGGSAPSPADIQPTRPAQQLADGPRQVAPPQRIEVQQSAAAGEPENKRSKKWLLAAGGAAVLVVALIATIVALMGGADNSPEGQVKAVIGDYTDALRSGDLEDLRASTCGELHEFYQGITAEQFNGVHQVSTERGSIPVVDSVDAVRITGDTALAQATVYTSADPSKRTARTFDLQRTDGSWKVCDPAGTP
ncbi:hypothetical protein [Nocardia sp. NPDC058633]|uniref:Rv0361 family membrane protein n=1 Tax=Nocardia sp. NPDC058633 TaxID=3346568 RepID=UPI003655813F